MSEDLALAPAVETEVTNTPAVEVDNTTENAPDTDVSEAEVKPEPTEVDKVKAASQKRIDKVIAQRAEMERRLNAAQDELLKLRPVQQSQDDTPKESDYETQEDYLKAIGRHEAKKEFEAQKRADAQKVADEAYSNKIAAAKKVHEENEAEIRKIYPDYDSVVETVNEFVADLTPEQQNSPVFQIFRDIMFDSKDMAGISYFLGNNPEKLEAMTKMNGLQAAREIFRIEYDLEKAPRAKAKTPLSDPPKALTGSSKPNKGLDDLSGKEILKRFKI